MEQKTRSAGVDYVKTTAILFVVCVHFFLKTLFYETPVSGFSMILQSYFRWIFYTGVPLFILCTGYLLNKKTVSCAYYKKMFRVLVPYIVIGALCIIVRFYTGENFFLRKIVSNFTHFEADPYGWYVNMYIGLFLLAPLLNCAVQSLNRKQLLAVVGTLVFLIALPAGINPITEQIRRFSFIHFPDWWQSFYPIMYYMLGAFIAKYPIRVPKWICCSVLAAVPALLTLLQLPRSGSDGLLSAWPEYGSVFVLLICAAIFFLLLESEIKVQWINKAAAFVSDRTLEIYLFSYITDTLLYRWFFSHVFDTAAKTMPQSKIGAFFFVLVPASFLSSLLLATIYTFFIKSGKRVVQRLRAKPSCT